MIKMKTMIKNSVPLCVPSVVLCVTKDKNYTEVHRGLTELHRDSLRPLWFHPLRPCVKILTAKTQRFYARNAIRVINIRAFVAKKKN